MAPRLRAEAVQLLIIVALSTGSNAHNIMRSLLNVTRS